MLQEDKKNIFQNIQAFHWSFKHAVRKCEKKTWHWYWLASSRLNVWVMRSNQFWGLHGKVPHILLSLALSKFLVTVACLCTVNSPGPWRHVRGAVRVVVCTVSCWPRGSWSPCEPVTRNCLFNAGCCSAINSSGDICPQLITGTPLTICWIFYNCPYAANTKIPGSTPPRFTGGATAFESGCEKTIFTVMSMSRNWWMIIHVRPDIITNLTGRELH